MGAIHSIMLHPMSPFVVTDGAIIFMGVKCSLDSRFLNGAWEQILLLASNSVLSSCQIYCIAQTFPVRHSEQRRVCYWQHCLGYKGWSCWYIYNMGSFQQTQQR
eukprot:11410962-Ditylum_brightwellii.AAC.1